MNQTNLPADTKLKCHDCGARACVSIEFGVDESTGYVDAVELCEDCIDELEKGNHPLYGISNEL